MTVRPWAGFIADFPDDEVSTRRDIEVFGGRNVAVALGEILMGLGCREVSEPAYAAEQGWEFNFIDREGHWFWCRVTSFHPAFWLLIEDPAVTRRARGKKAAAFEEIWRQLATALERDPRFHRILWRTAEEGPPEPEEIAAAPDPPARSFGQTFPRSAKSAPERRPGCWPIIFALWIILSGVFGLMMRYFSPGHADPSSPWGAGLITLVAGLVTLFWAINRRA